MTEQLKSIMRNYTRETEVVATYSRPGGHGPVRILRTTDYRRTGPFDVWVGEERVYPGVWTEGGARFLAANFAPEARPAA